MSIIRWRLRLVQQVLSGTLPSVSLGHLVTALGTSGMRGRGLTSEVKNGVTLWHSALGDFYGPADDDHGRPIMQMMLDENLGGLYERGGTEFKKGDIVLDCGANVGVFTRLAVRRGVGKVIAFEPNKKTADYFRANFKDELASGQVMLLETAAWHQTEMLSFERDDLMFRVSTEPTTVQVSAERIDDIVARLKLPRVDFIKMDIEGAERHALDGASATLRKDHPRLALCTYHLEDDPQAIDERVMAANPSYAKVATDQQVYYW